MEIKLEVLLNNLSKRVALLEASSHPPVEWNKNMAQLFERMNELELIIEEMAYGEEIPGEETEAMSDVPYIEPEN